jgi:hypothetical protein
MVLKTAEPGNRVAAGVSVVSLSVALRTWCGLRARWRPLGAVLCALALAGCAAGVAAPVGPSASMRHLLSPPAKPDCAFHDIGLGDTVPDAAEAARRKLEYERQCYRRAEMQMRARLRRLQAAVVAQTAAQAAPPCVSGLFCSRPVCQWR